MDKKNLPKVMAVSLSTWRSDSGIHTQTDLFKSWDPDCMSQIYTKSDLPDTPVCHRFFQIAENTVIRSAFTRKPVGCEVENGARADQKTKKAMDAEQKLYLKAHRKKSWFMTVAREIVWNLGRWKTKDLDSFINKTNPDVYFMPIYPVVYMGKLQLHILKKHPRPYVCYLSDDNYSYRACGKNPMAYIHRLFLRKVVKKLAVNCNEMFTITKTEAEDTDELFGTHSVILTGGIDYSQLEYHEKEISEPIRMVYTGKLTIGRASSLVLISKALAEINKDRQRMTLEVYSPDVMDKKTMKWLNSNGCHFRGYVPKGQVASIQEAADIAVFVESLEKKYRYAARLSFSTKLTDYFKSGKCIFAIGDSSIAPIEYLHENDAAIIATEYPDVQKQLCVLADKPEIIKKYGLKSFNCGKRNHDEPKVRDTLISTIISAYKPVAEKTNHLDEVNIIETTNRFSYEKEKRKMADRLTSSGVSAEQAETVADCFATADLYGVNSHGVSVLPAHIDKICHGGYNLKPSFRTVFSSESMEIIDGDNALGPVSASYCMDHAIERCHETGIFTVLSKNNNTFGPAFYYPLKAAEQGCIGIAFSNSPAQMAPMGGKTKMLGTNPFSAVIPVTGSDPIIIDMASSVAAKSKFREYKAKGKKLPDGWALDENGRPTDDPDEAIRGLVLPMSGFKGYGIAMLIDIMAGMLSGSAFLNHVGRFFSENDTSMNVGYGFVAADPHLFCPEYDHMIQNYVRKLRESVPAEGQQVLLPGDDRIKKMHENQH